MAEFTKQRLEEIKQCNVAFGRLATLDEVVIMADALLVIMDQEPVAYYFPGGGREIEQVSLPNDLDDEQKANCIPLSAAPQLPRPAVVVSEAQSKKLFDEWSGGDGALGELRASGVPDEFISMLKEFSLATWEACREAMLKHSAPFIVTSDHRMMEMPAIHDIDAVAAMLHGAEPVSQPYTLREGLAAIHNLGPIDAEKIQAERDALNEPDVPDGYALVPVEPTEKMVIEGFESVPHPLFQPADWDKYQTMSGCEQAAHRAKLCWAAMIKAAPKP